MRIWTTNNTDWTTSRKGKEARENSEEAKKLNFRRQIVAKQGDTLRDARIYIFSCRAKEWKISQQWESC
jgi:hypothetical protein